MKEKNFHTEDSQPATPGKKKGKAGFVIILILLILALAGAAGYYFYERSKPGKALDTYLSSIRDMDFTTMESMLQSNDLSALDSADIPHRCLHRLLSFYQSENDLQDCKDPFQLSGWHC